MQHAAPWLISPKQIVLERFLSNVLPAVILLTGPKELDKRALAFEMSALLLCRHPASHGACGKCQSCLLFETQTHTDFLCVASEKKEGSIQVDQSRDILTFLQNKPAISQKRVILIDNANRLNVAASNALLKALEEPPLDTTFFLTASNARFLLPTVKSRVFEVTCPIPTQSQMFDWLQGKKLLEHEREMYQEWSVISPVLVLRLLHHDHTLFKEMIQDLSDVLKEKKHPIVVATSWQAQAFEEVFDWWIILLHLLLRCAFLTRELPSLPTIPMQSIYELAMLVDASKIWLFLDTLQEKIRLLNGQNRLNIQLVFESLLIQWQEIKAPTNVSV